MNLIQIENDLKLLVHEVDKENFIYNLLQSYFLPKASISRLRKGSLNLSKVSGEVSWKKKLFFKEELENDLHLTISSLTKEIKHNQRFVIVTDYKTILAIDTLTKDQLDIPITDLPKYFDFFLPWAGMEKATHATENPADVKAAEKMAKLFDEIKKDNTDSSPEFSHSLNIFFSRLLFCYFAEDTNIFEYNQFSHAVESHTRADGSDLDVYLNRLFWVLNTPVDKRGDIPNYLNAFPYVNGGLFKEEISCPKFTSKSRQLLIESGDSNDWSAINPDIFGSMFQAVILPKHRGGLGAHYTSVPNIMKVIEPLFLNELKESYKEAIGNKKKLRELLHRISKIKLFDPACGSGNFLIIAYKELRRLEIQIIKELSIVKGNYGIGTLQLGNDMVSSIHLNNFYGIELDDFAHEIAKLSLWLAEHQMNVEFFNEFGRTNPTLPLQEAGHIVCGNACRLDWEKVCPKNEEDEIYIMGNPPYIGSRKQEEFQKDDLMFLFKTEYKSLDYIAAWFYQGSNFIQNTKSKCAFVTTNSICQGEQVSLTWSRILKKNVNIFFAYQDFKWSNNAKYNAGVTVVIVGLSGSNTNKRYLYQENHRKEVSEINPYLVEAKTIYIQSKQYPLSNFPEMYFGNMPADGGKLLFSTLEKIEFISKEPKSIRYFSKLISADEFINGKERWCLWLVDANNNTIQAMPLVYNLVSEIKDIRLKSSRPKLAEISYLFAQITQPKNKDFILIPAHSSENRKYIPIGYFNSNNISHNSCLIIPTNEIHMFSIITSKIHMTWVHAVCGRLETRYRYSKDVVYNNFPFPPISNQRKEELTQCTFRILEEREKHPEKTLAQLYDPDKMPEGLKEVHRLNDEAVERCYRSTPFNSDEERLEYLFKLYEKMIQEEKEKGTLFAAEKKTRKKK